jgi:anaerobic selenocysteine-containing dehydrogenase
VARTPLSDLSVSTTWNGISWDEALEEIAVRFRGNSRGQITLQARVDGSVRPGVVAARRDSVATAEIYVLSSEKLTDMGNAATFYSVCVEVELFRA